MGRPPWQLGDKESACNAGDARDPGSILGSGRSLGEGNDKPTPVFLPGQSCGPMSPWGCKEADRTEQGPWVKKKLIVRSKY